PEPMSRLNAAHLRCKTPPPGTPSAAQRCRSFGNLCTDADRHVAGVVTDPSGAAIAGSRVRVVKQDTGLTRALVTAGQGEYSASSLPSGTLRGYRRGNRLPADGA